MANIVSRAARLAQINDELSYLRGQAARTLCAYGVLMLEVQRDELWREGGQKSFQKWLEANHAGKVTNLRRGMRIAAVMSPDEAALCGTEKCELGVRLLAATPKVEAPGTLMTLPVRIRGPHGAFQTILFADAEVPQLKQGLELVAEATRRNPPPDNGVAALQASVGADVEVGRHASGHLVARPRHGMSAAELRALADALDRQGG